MKRKRIISIVIIAAAVILGLILFYPEKSYLTDGGTVEYRALTYRVIDYHKMSDRESEYLVGWSVSILGVEVYNDTRVVTE